MKLKDFNETFKAELQDREFAAGYLRVALEDPNEYAPFLIALRNIVNANGGFTQLAKTVGMGRESLYKALSEAGNPHFTTIMKVLNALNIKVDFQAEQAA